MTIFDVFGTIKLNLCKILCYYVVCKMFVLVMWSFLRVLTSVLAVNKAYMTALSCPPFWLKSSRHFVAHGTPLKYPHGAEAPRVAANVGRSCSYSAPPRLIYVCINVNYWIDSKYWVIYWLKFLYIWFYILKPNAIQNSCQNLVCLP